jgi:hypothetical protein
VTAFSNIEEPESKGQDGRTLQECDHPTLVKVNQSGINDVDTDVLLYTCAACGKPFTITDL